MDAAHLAQVSKEAGLSSSKVLERELGRRLKADPLLRILIGDPVPVLSAPSENDPLPYIVYNETRLAAWDDDTSEGGEHTLLFEFWSPVESEASVKEILNRIKSLIHKSEKFVSISPFTLVMIDFEFQDLIRETDGQAYRGTIQFRALTGEN